MNINKKTAPTLSISNAQLAFNQRILFENLNLTLLGGKWTCLLGPSGVGKTSLLRLIAKLKSPHTFIQANISSDQDTPIEKQISYIAQTDLLLPWLTVLDNVLLGTRLRKYSASDRNNRREKAEDLLNRVGLSASIHLFPRQLSGGMRQRVALVRTLIEDQPIVLMDEPFSALDTITRFNLQNLAAELLKDRTIFFITHDPLEALRLADEIYIMSGLPATLQTSLKLTSPTPRDPSSAEIIQLQAKLFAELVIANPAPLAGRGNHHDQSLNSKISPATET